MADATLVALVLGVATISIAWRQWAVARAKFKLDLFEHRYALFELLWTFLSHHVHDHPETDATHTLLQNSLPKFHFLFDKEIGDFASEALSHGNVHQQALRIGRNPVSAEAANQAATDASREYQWFHTEATGLRNRFSPYLQFAKWSRWWE